MFLRCVANGNLVETTVGRIIFNEALPERLRFKNYPMKKENLKQVIAECFREYGRQQTAELADEIKRLGLPMPPGLVPPSLSAM